MSPQPKCARCGHAAHKKTCRAKAPSGCMPLAGTDGTQTGIACYRGARPPCPCPWQTCSCGLLVAVAHLSGTGLDTAILRGSEMVSPIGMLAVREHPDGTMTARELAVGETLRPGEYRAVEHLPWPDHGPVAAAANTEVTS